MRLKELADVADMSQLYESHQFGLKVLNTE